jgi:flagellar motor switch protein FliN
MAEDDDLPEDELEALADAVGGGDDEGGDDLDPLAEEMLKMMEEEGGGDDTDSQEDVDRMMEMEMLKAMEDEGGGGGGGGGGGDFSGGLAPAGGGGGGGGGIPANIARLMDVSLRVTIELGRTKKTLEEVLNLGEQSLVELDKQVGDPVNVLVNGKLFARGEVVTVSENFGVRITEIMGNVTDL